MADTENKNNKNNIDNIETLIKDIETIGLFAEEQTIKTDNLLEQLLNSFNVKDNNQTNNDEKK